MLIAHYRSGSEFIEITKEKNGLYFIGYGAGFSKYTGSKYYNCSVGGFKKISDAINTLKKHRPAAEEIKTYCAKCKSRKILSYDAETKKTEFVHCNGEKANTCYTGCIYQNMKPLKKYTVCFIDGHDLKYKTVEAEAETKEKAVEKVFNMYGSNFEHKLTGVFEHD